LNIRTIIEQDIHWIHAFMRERWGDTLIVSRGRVHHADQLPGFVATEAEQPVGLVAFSIENEDCEIVSLDSLEPNSGIGSALVKAVMNLATSQHCKRVWLITTNDNTAALRFYQKRGFELVAIYRDAVKKAREIKPNIPEKGCDGIPIRDEIELEIRIGDR